MKKQIVCIFFIITMLVFCCACTQNHHRVNIDEQLETVYNEGIEKWTQELSDKKGTLLSEIADTFESEGIRTTQSGAYVKIGLKNGGCAFVFSDDGVVVSDVRVYEKIFCKDDFSFVNAGVTTFSDVLEFDPNAFLSDTSFVTISGHIIEEGVLLITYIEDWDGKLYADWLVKEIRFITNEDLLDNRNTDFVQLPYIFPEDKMGDAPAS